MDENSSWTRTHCLRWRQHWRMLATAGSGMARTICRCTCAVPHREEGRRGASGVQAMLSVRHLEDARMRLGKVIQHSSGGGVSI